MFISRDEKESIKMEPWDQRAARVLIRPLINTQVTPNHITTLRLMLGLGACSCLAFGGSPFVHVGAGLFVLSNFVDHMDGELARSSGKSSKIGHLYDLSSDILVHILLFVSIGIGLMQSELGVLAVILGVIAGVSITSLFSLFQVLEKRTGKKQAGLPSWIGFETEDLIYLIAPIIWAGGIVPVLYAASIGAPIFGIWAVFYFRRQIFKSKGTV